VTSSGHGGKTLSGGGDLASCDPRFGQVPMSRAGQAAAGNRNLLRMILEEGGETTPLVSRRRRQVHRGKGEEPDPRCEILFSRVPLKLQTSNLASMLPGKS